MITKEEKRQLLIEFRKYLCEHTKSTFSFIYLPDVERFIKALPDEGEKDKSNIIVGSKIKVCNDLVTTVIRIEDDRYYFEDEQGKIWSENLNAIKLITP